MNTALNAVLEYVIGANPPVYVGTIPAKLVKDTLLARLYAAYVEGILLVAISVCTAWIVIVELLYDCVYGLTVWSVTLSVNVTPDVYGAIATLPPLIVIAPVDVFNVNALGNVVLLYVSVPEPPVTVNGYALVAELANVVAVVAPLL